MVFSWRDTAAVCRDMIRVLEGVTISDVRLFEKTAAVLHFKGYEKVPQIVKELVDIMRLRGLFNKSDRWSPTLDIVWKSWVAFNGIVSPQDVQLLLVSSGPEAAKTISDKVLQQMIIIMKIKRQHGDD